MTSRTPSRQHRYLIEATGRDSLGTSFQVFDGAQGWGAAAQKLSEMFRRVPGSADYKVLECDEVAGTVANVTKAMKKAAEAAFHAGVDYDAARGGMKRQRRTISTYRGAA